MAKIYTEAQRALAAKLLAVYEKSAALSAYDSAIAHPRAALNSQIVALNSSRFAHDSVPKASKDKATRDAQREAYKKAIDEVRAKEDAELERTEDEENEDPEGTPPGSASQYARAAAGRPVGQERANDSAIHAFDYQGHADRLAQKLATIRRESAWNMPSLLWAAQVASDAQLPKQSGVSMDEAIPGYSRIGRQNGGRDCIKTRMA